METTRETLTKVPNSRLAEMVNSIEELDPVYFRPLLNWLRLDIIK